MTITINGTTGIAGVDGSASVPAFKGNDSDTGIFYPTSNEVAASAGGATVWNASGTFGFKNRLINGYMVVAQRGTSFTSLSNGTLTTVNAYCLDRWFGFRGAYAANLNASQQTGWDQYSNALRMQRASGTSGTQFMCMNQIIETANCYDLAGQSVTLSISMRSGSNFSGGTVSIAFQTSTTVNDSSANMAGGLFNAGTTSVTVTPTTTATTFTATGIVPAGARTIGIQIGYTPSGTAGANDFIEFTGVQLERGSTATSFDFRPIGAELQLCQRYYEQTNLSGGDNPFGMGSAYNSAGPSVISQTVFSHKVTKRDTPSAVTFTAASTFQMHCPGYFRNSCTVISLTNATISSLQIRSECSGTNPNVGGNAVILEGGTGVSSIGVTAEL